MLKIVIDCGHGLYTSGKRCLAALDPKQTREWVLNDRVGDELEIYLESAGHQVLRVDDIDGSTDVDLATRVAIANKWGADVYISVHHNAGIKGGSGGGTVVYVSIGCQSKSVKLQEAVYDAAIASANLKGNRSDGTCSANFYVVRKTKMPAILIECGFMDSSTDIKYILDPAWSKKMAYGIAVGICKVYGGTVKKDIPSTTVSTSKETGNAAKDEVKVEVSYILEIDGSFGPASVRRSQNFMGTKEDGVVSNQPADNIKYLPNVYCDCWVFEEYGYEDGSMFIKALQRMLKEKGYYKGKIDGWCGPKTIMAWQAFLRDERYYKGKIDGYMGPLTVMAWQRYLNDH